MSRSTRARTRREKVARAFVLELSRDHTTNLVIASSSSATSNTSFGTSLLKHARHEPRREVALVACHSSLAVVAPCLHFMLLLS